MSIGYILIMAVCAVSAILITLSRVIGFRNVIKYSVAVDFIVSSILVWVFFGTFIGMMIAIIAGLMMAIFLSVMRKLFKPPATKMQVKTAETKQKISEAFEELRKEWSEMDFGINYGSAQEEPSGSFFNR